MHSDSQLKLSLFFSLFFAIIYLFVAFCFVLFTLLPSNYRIGNATKAKWKLKIQSVNDPRHRKSRQKTSVATVAVIWSSTSSASENWNVTQWRRQDRYWTDEKWAHEIDFSVPTSLSIRSNSQRWLRFAYISNKENSHFSSFCVCLIRFRFHFELDISQNHSRSESNSKEKKN